MTTTVETTEPRLPGWPGVIEACPSWCLSLHDADAWPVDRVHWSDNTFVDVASLRPIKWDDDDEPVTSGSVRLHVEQHADAKQPRIVLMQEVWEERSDGRGNSSSEHELKLSREEALELGTRLIELSDEAV